MCLVASVRQRSQMPKFVFLHHRYIALRSWSKVRVKVMGQRSRSDLWCAAVDVRGSALPSAVKSNNHHYGANKGGGGGKNFSARKWRGDKISVQAFRGGGDFQCTEIWRAVAALVADHIQWWYLCGRVRGRFGLARGVQLIYLGL